MMSCSKKEIHEMLVQIFLKHKKRYKNPPKSKGLACMWSITAPPDIIEDTLPFQDIEKAFNISIDEDECLELYDMDLAEATDKMAIIIKNQC
jgi:hypothetical protein